MNRKLTLSVEERAIDTGKRYAARYDTSLSQVVETFLFLLDHDDMASDLVAPISPKLQSLVGIACGNTDEHGYRDHLEAHYA